ncbi:MAG: hypothetical protein WA861_02015 [Candidatus Binatus sp.]
MHEEHIDAAQTITDSGFGKNHILSPDDRVAACAQSPLALAADNEPMFRSS